MLLRPLPLLVLLAAILASPPAAAAPPSLVADLNTTKSSHDSGVGIQGSLVRLGNEVLFAALDYSSGSELWASDGTIPGTRLVSDICPGGCSSSPALLGATGRNAVFLAEIEDAYDARELWRSDGTREGTSLIKSGLGRCFSALRSAATSSSWPTTAIMVSSSGVPTARGTARSWCATSRPATLRRIPATWSRPAAGSSSLPPEYTLTVTDTQTGAARRYVNPPGRLGSVADTGAF